ncbi:MAG: carboxypeptidase-like regulatory domain-containing protein [Planctomycetota bacterium]
MKDRDSYGSITFRNLTQARAMTDRGFVAASTRTGADGSFEFAGLARGRYVVRAAAVSTEVFDQVISTPSVEAPAENVELRVSVQRVVVRLLDDKGVPLSFQPDDVTLKAEVAGVWRQSDLPRVVCRKSNGEGLAIDFIPKSCWLTGPSSREWTISLEPGAHYLIHAWCAGRVMVEREFFVGERRTPHSIDLLLGPKLADGRVSFEFEYPEGPNRVDKVRFNLFAAGSDVHLAEGRSPRGRLSLHLAPGSYRVNLQGSSDRFSWGSCQVVLDDDDFETQSRYRSCLPAPFNQTVHVEAGKEVSFSKRFEGRGGLQVDIAELEGKPKVQLATRRLGDLEWQPLIFSKPFAIMRHGAASESNEKDPDDWIRAGMSRRPDESLPVGRWEIRGRVLGYPDQVGEFMIQHGELSKVQLRF